MICQKLRTKIQKSLVRTVAKLSIQEAKLSIYQKKLFLALFCMLFCSLSIYLILNQLVNKTDKGEFSIKTIHIPYHIGKNIHQPGAWIDNQTFNRVEYFKKMLDSLKITDPVRFIEIMNNRPHLMDSIAAFEKFYLTQSKK
jgi:hypothetical protein